MKKEELSIGMIISPTKFSGEKFTWGSKDKQNFFDNIMIGDVLYIQINPESIITKNFDCRKWYMSVTKDNKEIRFRFNECNYFWRVIQEFDQL